MFFKTSLIPPTKEEFLIDTLSILEMDELKIPQMEALKLLSESKYTNFKSSMYTTLIFKK
jgi:hypothetical protein